MAREFARIWRARPLETLGKTMLKTLTSAFGRTPLPDLGAVRVLGADSVRFLQGQLSNDVAAVSPTHSQLAGIHTPQGRAIALLRLVAVGPDEVLAILPRELAAPVAARLSKFVLRAKAKVTDASADWQFTGLIAQSDDQADEQSGSDRLPDTGETQSGANRLPVTVGAQAQIDSSYVVRISNHPSRWIVASPASLAPPALALDAHVGEGSEVIAREQWRALDIAAGLPQIYAATSEGFVAQMLNLDAIDAVAFDKGCYTGQEIIARAHYRGRVKRRMQRFRSLRPVELTIGDAGKLRDGRSFRIVEVVRLSDGRSEFLAVAPTGGGEEEAPEAAAPNATAATAPLEAEQLPLPYELPA
jgi:folate-binding protein YgfZ